MAFYDALSANQLRATGLLLEINRLLLHPHGLSLAFSTQPDGTVILEVLDGRADPDGCIFDEKILTETYPKYLQFLEADKERLEARQAKLGYIVQPVAKKPAE